MLRKYNIEVSGLLHLPVVHQDPPGLPHLCVSQGRPLRVLHFADDIVLMADTNDELHDLTDNFAPSPSAYGLEISTDNRKKNQEQSEHHQICQSGDLHEWRSAG